MNTHRTLIRIYAVDKTKNLVSVCVPGWNPDEIVDFDLTIMPHNIRGFLTPGIRLFGYVNTSAETAQELVLERIEHRLHYPTARS